MAHLHLVAHDLFGVMANDALCTLLTSVEQDKYFQSGLDFTPLANLMGRADRKVVASDSVSLLATLFEIDDAETMPIAAYSYLADTGQPPQGYCLRADPVHLKADRDRVVLFRANDLLISSGESEQFTDEITSVLGEAAWKLETVSSGRWYIHLDKPVDLVTVSPYKALSDDVFHHLPSGKDAPSWRRLINEVQMLLHNSPLNALRSQGGLDPINSLWLWGGGVFKAQTSERWASVMSRDPLVQGMALASHTGCMGLPASAGQLESMLNIEDGEYLIVMEPCAESIHFGDIDSWFEYMRNLIEQWLVPLMNMLDNRKIDTVTLYPGNGYAYSLNRKMLRKWWHRKRLLSSMFDC